MTAGKAASKHLILFWLAALAVCLLLFSGTAAADDLSPANSQLVVLSGGTGGSFDAAADDYLLLEDDVIVLREADGFSLTGLDGAQKVKGQDFPLYQVSKSSSGLWPSVPTAGATVCFVPSGAKSLSEIQLMTVQAVSGDSLTAYGGPPESDYDGSAPKWFMRWVYKVFKDARYSGRGAVTDFTRELNYRDYVNMRISVNSALEIRIWKEDKNGPLYMSFGYELGIPSLTGSLDSKGGSVSVSLDLIEIPIVGIPEVGLNLTMGPELILTGQGTFRAHMTATRKTVKYTIYSDGSSSTDKSSSDGVFELDAVTGEMDCRLNLSMSMAFKALVISAGFHENTGYHFKVGVCGNDGGNPKQDTAADAYVRTWHLCKPGNCLNGGAVFESGWGFSISVGFGPFSVTLTGFDIPLLEKGMWNFYYSITYNEFRLVPYTGLDMASYDPFYAETPCPHKAWRLNVKAVHKNDPSKAVPYAVIGLAKAPDYKGRTPTEAAVQANSYFHTGSSGEGVLFIPADTQTVIRATDPLTSDAGEKAVRKYEAPESLVIEIDYKPLDLHFFPNTDEKVESMPQSRSAYPGDVVSLKGPSGFPRADGMEFAGWSEDPNARWNEPEKLVTKAELTLDRSYTFYAVWKRYFNIEFYNYDHSLLRSLRLPEFSAVAYTGARPTRPADEHYDYIFSGWEPVLETTALRNMVYTAQYWGKCKTFYTVTWVHEDGPTILETDENVIYLAMPQYNGPTPTKGATSSTFYFSGWDPEPSPVTGNITYTARFSTVPTEMCVVTFKGGGGYLVPEPQLVLQGNPAVRPARDPARDGYEFGGWLLEGNPYDFTDPVLNSLTLTASWLPVTYSFTEGDGQTWLNTAEQGPSFRVSRNLRDEKTFGLFAELFLDGGSEPLDGTHFTHEKGSLRLALLPDYARTLSPGTHRLRAVFADGEAQCAFTVRAGAYSISYNLAGGRLPEGAENPETYTSEDAFTLVNPVMEGHTFIGWTGTGLPSRSLLVTVPKGSSGNRNYTAHWVIGEKGMVIFFDTGSEPASGIPEPILFDPETTTRVVLPSGVPLKDGWRFLGWNTRENGSGAGYAPGSPVEVKGNLALYAQWEKLIPPTGDSGSPHLWAGLVVLGLLSLAVISFLLFRKK